MRKYAQKADERGEKRLTATLPPAFVDEVFIYIRARRARDDIRHSTIRELVFDSLREYMERHPVDGREEKRGAEARAAVAAR